MPLSQRSQDIIQSKQQPSEAEIRELMADLGEDRGNWESAFRIAAIGGNNAIFNHLIASTSDPAQLQKMIRQDDNHAFRVSTATGYLHILNRLVELTPDPAQLQEMIRSINDKAFRCAATGHPESIIFLAVVCGVTKVEGKDAQEILDQNQDKITKLGGIRERLIKSFKPLQKQEESQSEQQDFEEEKEGKEEQKDVKGSDKSKKPNVLNAAENAANSVIVALLTGKNLSLLRDNFVFKQLRQIDPKDPQKSLKEKVLSAMLPKEKKIQEGEDKDEKKDDTKSVDLKQLNKNLEKLPQDIVRYDTDKFLSVLFPSNFSKDQKAIALKTVEESFEKGYQAGLDKVIKMRGEKKSGSKEKEAKGSSSEEKNATPSSNPAPVSRPTQLWRKLKKQIFSLKR
jgi:hypothetical protein